MLQKTNVNLKRFLVTCLAAALLLTVNGLLLSSALGAALSPALPAYAEGAADTAITNIKREKTMTATPEMEKDAALWDELIATHGEDVDWPLEVWAEYSQRRAALGITTPDFIYGLPAEDEVQLADAMDTANAHLLATMGFKDDMLDRFTSYVRYFVSDPERPYYQISYNPKVAEEYQDIGAYLCIVDGKTGEVTEFLTPADAKG